MLIESFDKSLHVISEPYRIECGSPDYIIMRNSVLVGYIEAKGIGTNQNKEERSDQMKKID
jgi:predicted type IV restriction endonuclease